MAFSFPSRDWDADVDVRTDAPHVAAVTPLHAGMHTEGRQQVPIGAQGEAELVAQVFADAVGEQSPWLERNPRHRSLGAHSRQDGGLAPGVAIDAAHADLRGDRRRTEPQKLHAARAADAVGIFAVEIAVRVVDLAAEASEPGAGAESRGVAITRVPEIAAQDHTGPDVDRGIRDAGSMGPRRRHGRRHDRCHDEKKCESMPHGWPPVLGPIVAEDSTRVAGDRHSSSGRSPNRRSHSAISPRLWCSGFSRFLSSLARACWRLPNCKKSATRRMPAPCARAVSRISRSDVTIVSRLGSGCDWMRSRIQVSALSRAYTICKPR